MPAVKKRKSQENSAEIAEPAPPSGPVCVGYINQKQGVLPTATAKKVLPLRFDSKRPFFEFGKQWWCVGPLVDGKFDKASSKLKMRMRIQWTQINSSKEPVECFSDDARSQKEAFWFRDVVPHRRGTYKISFEFVNAPEIVPLVHTMQVDDGEVTDDEDTFTQPNPDPEQNEDIVVEDTGKQVDEPVGVADVAVEPTAQIDEEVIVQAKPRSKRKHKPTTDENESENLSTLIRTPKKSTPRAPTPKQPKRTHDGSVWYLGNSELLEPQSIPLELLGPVLSCHLPKELKRVLLDDRDIARKGIMHPLPRDPTVSQLIQKAGKRSKKLVQDAQVLVELLRTCFDGLLHTLLYPSERDMYPNPNPNSSGKGLRPCDVYGAQHLLRMIVLLTQTPVSASEEVEPSDQSVTRRKRDRGLTMDSSQVTELQDIINSLIRDMAENVDKLF